MIITTITRKVTGGNYDNISMTAAVSGEDPIKIAMELDKKCHEALNTMVEDKTKKEIRNHEEGKMLDKIEALKKAISKHEISELPF